MLDYSKKKKTLIAAILFLLIAGVFQIHAESVWEGSAAMGRYGEFPFTGFYGASNSFPQNAYVEVENLENGKRTRVIIVNRLTTPGLLMLVSNEAAQELGIYQSDIARIKVRMISSGNTTATPQYDDLAFNPDPDINPAAALMEPEDFIVTERSTEPSNAKAAYDATADAVHDGGDVAAEAETDIQAEPEPEADNMVAAEPAPAAEDDRDELNEAEILVDEDDLADQIIADVPEKPFDWPDSALEPEKDPVPEPLYLTMDELVEGEPLEEAPVAETSPHTPDASPLWPDGVVAADLETDENDAAALINDKLDSAAPETALNVTGGAELVEPETALELLSSGLVETSPGYRSEKDFEIAIVPDLQQKESEAEFLTATTGYYSPEASEDKVAQSYLPEPELEIPEEVIAVLVGDHLGFSETNPQTDKVATAYSDTPQIKTSATDDLTVIAYDLAETIPLEAEADDLAAANIPALPDAAAADEARETELAYTIAPDADDSALPEISEVPELLSAAEKDEADAEDFNPAVPEYDENLEVTLVPAEARPPELVEADSKLDESEPETAETADAADIAAEHSPAVQDENAAAQVTAAAEPETETAPVTVVKVVPAEAVVTETKPEPEVGLTVPEQIMMVTKLQQKKHYLQLGAFKEKNSAIKAAGNLEAEYPVTILTDEASAGVSYKLLLGPLTADESGIMLYNFRAGGYSDAFIRRIE